MATHLPPSNGKTLLVTGINGYIASTLGHLILTKGYTLRGTTRRLASVKPLLDGAYAEFASRVQVFEVPDITAAGAFDEAVTGVHGIFHTASPIDFSKSKFEDFVVPAVEGTKTLLNSALKKAGPQLEAVVVTSSVRAVLGETVTGGKVYNESSFPTDSLALAETDKAAGRTTAVGTLYSASKMAAEQAMWKFRDEFKPPFALATVLPSVVIGPPIQPPASSEQLNDTLKPLWKIFSSSSKDQLDSKELGSGQFCDVRDVAAVHLWAGTHASESANQRYIASGGFMPPQAVADILRCEYPEMKNIPVGVPGAGYVGYEEFETGNTGSCVWEVDFLEGRARFDSSKAKEAFGKEWKKLRCSVVDTARVMERYL